VETEFITQRHTTASKQSGVGKLGRSKLGLGNVGLGKLGSGKVGPWFVRRR